MAYANESRKAVDGKMSDLIRREDAVQMLDEYIKPFVGLVGDIGSGINGAREIIKSIPSADRPQEWVPCSERLPKKEEATYLICTETGYMCSCRWTNDKYGLGSNEWSKWGWNIMDKPQYAKVVAWMLLKPWEGADDDYERAVEQMEYDILYEPTYNPEDGSM